MTYKEGSEIMIKEEAKKESPITAEDVVALMAKTFSILSSETDLSPRNPAITDCLTNYVNQLVEAEYKLWQKQAVLGHDTVNHIRPNMLNLLSQAEFEMECYFADKFSEAEKLSQADLDNFWYRDNYKALVAQEVRGLENLGLLNKLHQTSKPMAFVGAGPLPLSAIDYFLQTGKSCVCFDIDQSAVLRGKELIEKLGMQNLIEFKEAAGEDIDFADYSLILVASLVGGKADVLNRIHATAPDAMVGVRSAEGLMTLLYEPVDINAMNAHGFRYCGMAPATAETINSTCFFQGGAALAVNRKKPGASAFNVT